MKKYFITTLILFAAFAFNLQMPQAKADSEYVGSKQDNSATVKKHPVAKSKRNALKDGNISSNVVSNRRLEGKQKAIERRLQGKEKAMQRRSHGHKGHGKYKKSTNNNAYQNRHTNRGNYINSQNQTDNKLKHEKNKKYIE